MSPQTDIPAAIDIRDLKVQRGHNLVLPGVSVRIRPGIITGVLGPSGSGKSTLMRAIVGVQIVAGGTVEVLGLPAGSPSLRRRVAYVTQQPSVYADLSVRQNLEYFAGVLGAGEAAIERAITTVGLADQTHQLTGTLSGGERGRSSLAAALLGDPELLVLDEPTVGLDPVLRQELWATFHSLTDEGKTILVSTHVMDEADRCDQLILMRDGQVVASGSAAELRERTGTETVEEAFLALAEGPK